MLFQEIAERFVGQLLQRLCAVERQLMQGMPCFGIKLDAFANLCWRLTSTRRHHPAFLERFLEDDASAPARLPEDFAGGAVSVPPFKLRLSDVGNRLI
jgi:hypothetical protein